MVSNAIQEIISGLNQQKLAVFCGAGISYNSGLPIVSQILSHLFKTLELDTSTIDRLFESGIPFERVIEMLLIESEISEIQDIFLEGSPNCNHLFLAKLSKYKFLKIIYTTNFDVLIEKGLESEGLVNGQHFKVYRTEEELRNIDWKDDNIKIIKIHGCVTMKEEMAITLSQLASERYLDLRRNLISQIFSSRSCSSVLLMGYSCSDFDLVPIIENSEDPSAEIYFIEHSRKESRIEPIHVKVENNPFQSYKGIRLIDSTDHLVSLISTHLNLTIIPTVLNQPVNWREYIDLWYINNLDISGPGFKHHITAKLLYGIGDNHGTIIHAQQSVDIAHKNKNANAYASELGTMGLAYNRLGEYEKASKCFNESIPILRQLKNEFGIAAQTQSYGNVLHHLGKNDEAITFFQEALAIARRHENEFTESNILGNIANCYIALKQLLMAKYYVDRSVELSKNLGNKQAESSQLGILARIYFEMGEFSKSLEIMLPAIHIKKSIADNNELCKLYLNITNTYIALGDRNKAQEFATECLELARYLDNSLLEKMILFTIKFNSL